MDNSSSIVPFSPTGQPAHVWKKGVTPTTDAKQAVNEAAQKVIPKADPHPKASPSLTGRAKILDKMPPGVRKFVEKVMNAVKYIFSHKERSKVRFETAVGKLKASATTEEEKVQTLIKDPKAEFSKTVSIGDISITEAFEKDYMRSDFIVNGVVIRQGDQQPQLKEFLGSLVELGASKDNIGKVLRFVSQMGQPEVVMAAMKHIGTEETNIFPEQVQPSAEKENPTPGFREINVDKNTGRISIKIHTSLRMTNPSDQSQTTENKLQAVQIYHFNDDYEGGDVELQLAELTPKEFEAYQEHLTGSSK